MADALASGASVRKDVGVQVPPRARWAYMNGTNARPPIDVTLLNQIRWSNSIVAAGLMVKPNFLITCQLCIVY